LFNAQFSNSLTSYFEHGYAVYLIQSNSKYDFVVKVIAVKTSNKNKNNNGLYCPMITGFCVQVKNKHWPIRIRHSQV
jgi:predicted nucleotide-binding protein (sugar kinase/HSP70/actin superfamily)